MADLKISELPPASTAKGGEMLPFAMGGANGSMTADQLAAQSLRNHGRRLIIGAAGDSIADFFMGGQASSGASSSTIPLNTPLSWALADYPADVHIDGRSYANGGYNFGVGGSTSAQMLSVQLPQIVARPPDVLFIQTFQNDALLTVADIATFAPNAEATASGALAAGVKVIAVLSCPPHNTRTGAQRARAVAGLNERMARFALATPGVIYLDTLHFAVDPSYATAGALVPYKGHLTPSAADSVSADGVHFSNFGAKRTAPPVIDLLKRLAHERTPRAIIYDGGYSADNPYGNLLRDNGLFVGTTGTYNGAANAGVATGWTVSDNNGVIVTPTNVTDDLGFKAQKLTFSGTAGTGGSTITLAASPAASYLSPAPPAGQYELECQVSLDALAGCSEVTATINSASIASTQSFLPGVAALTKDVFLCSRRGANMGGSNSWNLNFKLVFPAGTVPTGSILISRFGAWRVD